MLAAALEPAAELMRTLVALLEILEEALTEQPAAPQQEKNNE
jgi:hypothetical protein